jgi:WhiB family transcriptional regulator, redox-sensing transcriptional regulator
VSGALRVYAPGLTSDTPYRWQDDALCAETNPDLFFPVDGDSSAARKALEICADCPVQRECGALGMEYRDGIFGGMTPTRRALLRRGREA